MFKLHSFGLPLGLPDLPFLNFISNNLCCFIINYSIFWLIKQLFMPVFLKVYKPLEVFLYKITCSLVLIHKKPCINENNKGSGFFNTPFVDCKCKSLLLFSAYLLNSSFLIECVYSFISFFIESINLLLQYQLLKPYMSNVLTFSYGISSCPPSDLALFYMRAKPLLPFTT